MILKKTTKFRLSSFERHEEVANKVNLDEVGKINRKESDLFSQVDRRLKKFKEDQEKKNRRESAGEEEKERIKVIPKGIDDYLITYSRWKTITDLSPIQSKKSSVGSLGISEEIPSPKQSEPVYA